MCIHTYIYVCMYKTGQDIGQFHDSGLEECMAVRLDWREAHECQQGDKKTKPMHFFASTKDGK